MTTSATQERVATGQRIPGSENVGQTSSSLVTLAQETFGIMQGFLTLLALELRLAAKSIPMIIALGIVAFLLVVFTWLSFATGLAWLGAIILGSTGWGIAVFLAAHLLALFGCRAAMSRYVRKLTLPNSRKFLKQMEEGWRESHE